MQPKASRYWQHNNGRVHKLNLADLDQSRAISSGARPFINYLRAIHSVFINSGVKQSEQLDVIQVRSVTKARTTLRKQNT